MPTSRRAFVKASGLACGHALFFDPVSALAMPRGARRPAPASPPAFDGQAAKALAASPLPALAKFAEQAVQQAVDTKATYADARLVRWRSEYVSVRDDHIDDLSQGDEIGIGIRVLADGGWGFAATPELNAAAVKRATATAVAAAKRAGALRRATGSAPITLAEAPAVKGQWVAPHSVDPFSVGVADKAALLIEGARGVLGVAGVGHARGSVTVVGEDKLLVTSDGTQVHQIFFRLMPSLTATAVDRRRGGFASANHEVAPMLAGWDYVTDLDLAGTAAAVGELAVAKLHAHSVEPGPRTVVLAPSNLWLTIHESIGHPTELDRAVGMEADYAGTSFIKRDDAGSLQLGSEHVNLMADRTQPGGLATTAWDDEGVAAQRWPIVQGGRFVGWQTTRDQAAWIGENASRGCSYGERYRGVQFQRMPNVSLQPGPEGHTTEDLINATEDGIYIAGRGSWSIDHQRYNFQFSGQSFWEIKKGRLTRPLKDVAYQAKTADFWKSCDMVGGAGTYRLGGSFHDGKGQPGQSNAVSHGCPPARFSATIVNTAKSQ